MSKAKPGSTRRWYRRFNVPFWASVIATLACTFVYLGHRMGRWEVPGVDSWEKSSTDIRFDLRGTRPRLDDRIVIVALDDETRENATELWQTRRGFARLLDKLTQSKPRAIGIDVFFSTPEVNLSEATIEAVVAAQRALQDEAAALETQLSPAARTAEAALALVATETSGDKLIAQSVKNSENLVMAGLFYLEETPLPPGTPEPLGYARGHFDEAVHLAQPVGKRPAQAHRAVPPIALIGQYVRHMGHVNIYHDKDGAVREVPVVIERAGRYYQSLALKLASMELGLKTSYVAGDNFVRLGTKRIELSAKGVATVGYLGGNGVFTRVSALQVLNNETPLEALEDKIVLVGYTDTIRDKIITPFEQQYDGVALHATLLHNILHDQLIRRATPAQTCMAMLALGFIFSLMQLRRVRKRGAWLLGVAALLSLGAYLVIAQVLFDHSNMQLDVAIPCLSGIAILLTSLIVSLATEGREKAQLRSAFGQYLQSSLIEKLLQDPEQLKLGGQRRELTVLFSDIRSFSRFSEQLEPDDLSDFLNEYLTPMTDIVMGNFGMLDKYIGDAVMAVYGAPLPLDDHAERACKSALLMMENLVPMNKVWKERGLPEIKIGIGLNTGQMSVGNMGSQAHFDYTVMGDAVNLGARLESLTKAYQVAILVGEATQKAASKNYVFREIDSVRVIGRTAAARVYELCGAKGQSPIAGPELSLYADALASYRKADWDTALAQFNLFVGLHPSDGPAQTMIERIALLRDQDLGEDWNGVYEQSGK